jgi:hypothetical protein
MSTFVQPSLIVGDRVLFYDNPQNPQKPCFGFVSRKPGVSTISILVYGGDVGFIEKPSVRHKDDPFWQTQESGNWGKWGCYEIHPESKLLAEIQQLLAKAKTPKKENALA